MYEILLSVAVISFVTGATSESTQDNVDRLSFASYYGDHMVLQQAPLVANVWGYASVSRGTVELSIDKSHVVTARIKKSYFGTGGIWIAQLPPMKAGGPHVITANGTGTTATLKDVMFGDVWLCAGQENMHFTLSMDMNASEEIKEASRYKDIRVFTVGMNKSSEMKYDLEAVEEQWSVPSPESVGKHTYFSALCWLYGKRLYKKLGYPVGLIASSYPDSPIEAWSSPESLKECQNTSSKTPGTMEKEGPNNMYDGNPLNKSELYYSMIHPLFNITIYGIIWYQGKSDTDPFNTNYNCTFPALIDSWREGFYTGTNKATDRQLPFGFVQLSAGHNNPREIGGTVRIRWRQTANFGYVPNPKMKNVFMAVAIDLPDFTSPWGSKLPRNKHDIADRLEQSSLAIAYHQNTREYAGPFPVSIAKMSIPYMTIKYDKEITVKNDAGFEICCCSGIPAKCHQAEWRKALIHDYTSDSVVLSYPPLCELTEICIVRYAWHVAPCQYKNCSIYGANSDLPAPPFFLETTFG